MLAISKHALSGRAGFLGLAGNFVGRKTEVASIVGVPTGMGSSRRDGSPKWRSLRGPPLS